MPEINIIFPHQLFEKTPLPLSQGTTFLIEEYLFFKQYNFHQQKIAYHRASMKAYEAFLIQKGGKVNYIASTDSSSDIREFINSQVAEGTIVHYIDPTDDWLSKRLLKSLETKSLESKCYDSPLFLNSKAELQPFFRADKKKFFQTKFYIDQRKKRNLLIIDGDKPEGGKWSFDAENRKKYPKQKVPPPISYPPSDQYYEEAKEYVNTHFADHLGQLSEDPLYPYTFKEAKRWLQQFLEQRFLEFGPYEDAIVTEYQILNHSVLTPMLNTGLLTPNQIISATKDFISENEIPINSTEGFIRQIIGWREFIRGVYEAKGREERLRNYWGFDRKIPASFYDGSTGIPPIDQTINKVLATGYCHHIERLMVLGNFMLLCEFDPDEVYRWFMELFIDAYDWVMVPNVYGMSQFADGGLMSTKPYISGSNYLMKMSNYMKGDWQQIWDGLFWRFMHVHRDFFLSNPRIGMLVHTYDRMSVEKQNAHLKNAELYLEKLS